MARLRNWTIVYNGKPVAIVAAKTQKLARQLWLTDPDIRQPDPDTPKTVVRPTRQSDLII